MTDTGTHRIEGDRATTALPAQNDIATQRFAASGGTRLASAAAEPTAVASSSSGSTASEGGAYVSNATELGDDHAAGAPVRPGIRWTPDLRFMIVVLAAIVALFLAFALLIAFNPTDAAVSALAVVAAPIATIVAAYYGISLALRQVRDARSAADAADERAREAERAARESDAWAAQMESGLRVAVAKLRGTGGDTRDVERAAGTPDEFF